MDNRIVITKIHIENFRSIRKSILELTDMNIFVGLNDAGKSNYLKALNLFFNNNTDYDTSFDHAKDFSFLFPTGSHKAKEIIIELHFQIPPTYNDPGIYIWRKTWRENGLYKDIITKENGEAPSERSRIPTTLKRIKYRYVPAVKSKDYYKYLLSELYLTASASLDSPIASSTQDFANVIQRYTDQIHNEVSQKIGIESKLTIPEDMTEMFKTLVFMTSSGDSSINVPLDMRGDGIQTRHIPIILKYIADEDLKTKGQGAVKIVTIWGYEEPENGIELLKSFEVAKSFVEYSKEIQMLVSTHSAAFYQQRGEENSKVFLIEKSEHHETIASETVEYNQIGRTMGLLPLVAPFIEEKEREIKRAHRALTDELSADIPTIFVEGKTDKELIGMAIKLLSPSLTKLIDSGNLRFYTKDGKGGCLKVNNNVYAWIYSGNRSKVIAIYDKDEAGQKAYGKISSNPLYKDSKKQKGVKILYIPPNDSIKELLKNGMLFTYEIEHLLSVSCWRRMIDEGYVSERDHTELYQMIARHADKNKSTVQLLQELIPNSDIRETIVNYIPSDDCKSKIVRMIEESSDDLRKEYLAGLQPLISELEKRFVI